MYKLNLMKAYKISWKKFVLLASSVPYETWQNDASKKMKSLY